MGRHRRSRSIPRKINKAETSYQHEGISIHRQSFAPFCVPEHIRRWGRVKFASGTIHKIWAMEPNSSVSSESCHRLRWGGFNSILEVFHKEQCRMTIRDMLLLFVSGGPGWPATSNSLAHDSGLDASQGFFGSGVQNARKKFRTEAMALVNDSTHPCVNSQLRHAVLDIERTCIQ